MARQMYVKEYTWFVPNDDNRVQDGKDLRDEFLATQGIDEVDRGWYDLGCSMLEMLIALSRRLSFEADQKTAGEWFGILLQNIGLDRCNDKRMTVEMEQHIDEVMQCVIYRQYSPTGEGGLFPLRNPQHDQREVEVWYQMSAYLIENGLA